MHWHEEILETIYWIVELEDITGIALVKLLRKIYPNCLCCVQIQKGIYYFFEYCIKKLGNHHTINTRPDVCIGIVWWWLFKAPIDKSYFIFDIESHVHGSRPRIVVGSDKNMSYQNNPEWSQQWRKKGQLMSTYGVNSAVLVTEEEELLRGWSRLFCVWFWFCSALFSRAMLIDGVADSWAAQVVCSSVPFHDFILKKEENREREMLEEALSLHDTNDDHLIYTRAKGCYTQWIYHYSLSPHGFHNRLQGGKKQNRERESAWRQLL